MTEQQLCDYIRDAQKCTELATIFCQVGTCLPGTHYCPFHYAQVHSDEEEPSLDELAQEAMHQFCTAIAQETEQSIMTTLKEIESSEQEPTEPVLVPCPHCGSHHVKQAVEAHLCPLDPQRPPGW